MENNKKRRIYVANPLKFHNNIIFPTFFKYNTTRTISNYKIYQVVIFYVGKYLGIFVKKDRKNNFLIIVRTLNRKNYTCIEKLFSTFQPISLSLFFFFVLTLDTRSPPENSRGEYRLSNFERGARFRRIEIVT